MPAVVRQIVFQVLIAAVAVFAVYVFTMSLTAFVETDVSTVYLAAVMIAAWRGGLLAGLVATFLSAGIATYFFLPPVYTFSLKSEGVVELIVFALAAVLVSSLVSARERALIHEQLARNEAEDADRVKDEFLATASHELRTPLTTIKALTRLLMRGEPSDEKRREYLETISVECDRQIDLVLNLLDLSRIEGGVFRLSLEKVNVTDVIDSCVKSEMAAAEKRKHKLEIATLPGEIQSVCADPKALRRVVSNLIENAIKYTPDGGSITVSAATTGGFSTISVTDNGRGIREEDLPMLFEKFHRGRPAPHSEAMRTATEESDFLEDADVSGVGLGLYLAKSVMNRMNGHITVETASGSGTVTCDNGQKAAVKVRTKGGGLTVGKSNS